MKRHTTYLMLSFVMVFWTSGIVVAKTIGNSIGALEFSLLRWGFAVFFPCTFCFTKNFDEDDRGKFEIEASIFFRRFYGWWKHSSHLVCPNDNGF